MEILRVNGDGRGLESELTNLCVSGDLASGLGLEFFGEWVVGIAGGNRDSRGCGQNRITWG